MSTIGIVLGIFMLLCLFFAQASAYKCYKETQKLREDLRLGIEAILKAMNK